jgi:Flp pilus assembly protein TadD
MDDSLETLRPLAEAVMGQQLALDDEMAAGTLLDYGRALIATGSHVEAIAPLELASGLDPGNSMIWQSLGQALAVAGRRDEASAALERFSELAQNAVPATVQSTTLEKDVDDPTARQLREALKLAGQGRTAEALDETRRERRMSPGDPRVLLVESRILTMLDQREEALTVATETVEMAPDLADAYYQRGVVLMGLHRLGEAEADFRRSLEIAPGHAPTLNDLAVLLMFLERDDEARELLERALEINPDDSLAKSNLSQLDS